MIYLDYTKVSVVIVCDECDLHLFAFTKLEGWRRAAAHEERAHAGRYNARDALRHAESAG